MTREKIRTFRIYTLGCKVNQYEEQVLREHLREMGLEESPSEPADLYIVNSCTVTERADRKTRKLIRKIKKDSPRARTVVTGCYAITPEDREKLGKIREVDILVPGDRKMEIPSILARAYGLSCVNVTVPEKISGFHSHTRAFIKVQDGCDQNCAYCKVNIVRGPSRSKKIEDILDEARCLAAKGYREMVLTGICLGSWKGENGGGLADLVSAITGSLDGFRLRLSSIEPNHVNDAILDIMASSSRVCRHLHIPLQSGCDDTLARMKRRYDTSRFFSLIERVRHRVPLMGISMDVIVGFPGETHDEYRKTLDFVKGVRPSRLHVFPYSPRKGTAAFDMPGRVNPLEVKERCKEFAALDKSLRAGFCERLSGKDVDILVEGKISEQELTGYTGEYAPVKLIGKTFLPGQLITARPLRMIGGISPSLLVTPEDPFTVI